MVTGKNAGHYLFFSSSPGARQIPAFRPFLNRRASQASPLLSLLSNSFAAGPSLSLLTIEEPVGECNSSRKTGGR